MKACRTQAFLFEENHIQAVQAEMDRIFSRNLSNERVHLV